MQTNIHEQYRNTEAGREADSILRSCVHCGFCTATCPTYQLLGDELDGPRGRIYLIKQMLEGKATGEKTRLHLDRCLTCRSCETTCPSGVRYGRLVDIGREIIAAHTRRPLWQSLQRSLLRKVIPYPQRFAALLKFGQLLSPLLPPVIKRKLPAKQTAPAYPQQSHKRRMLILQGCAQSVATPGTNAVTARIMNKLGIELEYAGAAGCCGAVSQHLAEPVEALQFVRRNIDAWWPFIEAGSEAIVVTASGCGVMLKEYGELLKHDADYADKAKRISELTRDISEVLSGADLSRLGLKTENLRVAFHSPCTLQHGLKLEGVVENILDRAGFSLTRVADAHLCCGSAGTYSVLQAKLSQQLLNNKLKALESDVPDVIATANIGCQLHLGSKSRVPVIHWIELLDSTESVSG